MEGQEIMITRPDLPVHPSLWQREAVQAASAFWAPIQCLLWKDSHKLKKALEETQTNNYHYFSVYLSSWIFLLFFFKGAL